MERAFWWDNRQNKRLSIYSFHQNESMAPSIVSFLFLVRQSVRRRRSQWGSLHGEPQRKGEQKRSKTNKLVGTAAPFMADFTSVQLRGQIVHRSVPPKDPGRDRGRRWN